MNTSRVWTLGAVAAVVVVVAGAVGLGVQPALAAASAAESSTQQTDAQSATAQVELARLSRLSALSSDLEATNNRYRRAVTGSLRLSTFSQQVRDTAALDGVTLVSLDPGTAKPYAPLAAPVAAPAASSSSATPAPGATAAPTAPVITPGQFGGTSPLITAGNFTVIPVTVSVTGTESASVQFASDLQHMNRLFAVDTVSYTLGTNGQPSATILSGSIYALQS